MPIMVAELKKLKEEFLANNHRPVDFHKAFEPIGKLVD